MGTSIDRGEVNNKRTPTTDFGQEYMIWKTNVTPEQVIHQAFADGILRVTEVF